MRIRQWRCPIFISKIWQSFAFGVLWCTGKVLRLCIRLRCVIAHQTLESIIQSAQSPTHMQEYIYIYINMHHAQRYHTEQENKPNIANVPRVWPSKVREK